jgi:6-phosphogluconolactonase
VQIAGTAPALFADLGAALQRAVTDAVGRRGLCHLALSGGSTPEPFYRGLARETRWSGLDWEHARIWLVDERRVPATDPRSNQGMIARALGPRASAGLRPVPALSPDPAAEYERMLVEATGGDALVPRLDFVLLGMGGDGHTASLFPQSPAILERNRLIAPNDGPSVTPPPRVTMTYPLLNAAREIAVLCTGRAKTEALSRVNDWMREHGPDPARYPITGIRPASGALTWYLDTEAAGRTQPDGLAGPRD